MDIFFHVLLGRFHNWYLFIDLGMNSEDYYLFFSFSSHSFSSKWGSIRGILDSFWRWMRKNQSFMFSDIVWDPSRLFTHHSCISLLVIWFNCFQMLKMHLRQVIVSYQSITSSFFVWDVTQAALIGNYSLITPSPRIPLLSMDVELDLRYSIWWN